MVIEIYFLEIISVVLMFGIFIVVKFVIVIKFEVIEIFSFRKLVKQLLNIYKNEMFLMLLMRIMSRRIFNSIENGYYRILNEKNQDNKLYIV